MAVVCRWKLLFLASMFMLCPLLAMTDTMDGEIQYLLVAIEQSQCDFVRNQNTHSAADAADHLRRKYQRGRQQVKSTEHFIDRIASESAWTGDPYQLVCPGQGTEFSRDWLYRKLGEYRQGQ